MFKNMLKRSWLSVKRKPGRSIIIGLLLFAMSNLILATIVIRSAVSEQTEYAKESLGGTVSIQADMSKLREEMGELGSEKPGSGSSSSGSSESGSSSGGSSGSGGSAKSGGRAKFERPSVTKTVADAISESEYVKDYTYSVSSSADAESLTAVESASGGGFGGGPEMMKGGSEEDSGDFTISGINSYAFISQVESGSMTISEGEYFDEDDEDKCIISVDLAEENDLSVGDTIKFKNSGGETVKLTVMGIYDVSENMFDANTIYMNVDTAAKFLSDDDYNDGDYDVESVSYELVNAEDAEEFIAWIDAEFPELAEKNLTASEDTRAYDQMVGPIESVGSFATTILIVVIIAAVVIITLIVMINVRDRHYEMGVLLSLGARKGNIIGQIFLELALVGTVAFVGASLTSTAVAGVMGQGILESQIASSSEQSEQNFGRPSGGPGGGGQMKGSNKNAGGSSDGGGAGSSSDGGGAGDNGGAAKSGGAKGASGASSEEVIDEIDISAKPVDFLLLFVCGYGILLVALLIPSISVLRYQPKKILQGKE